MAQILCWDVDYKPKNKPWSLVKCLDKKKVLSYLQQDSIILVSTNIWTNIEHKKYLSLSKIHYPNIEIGIIVSRAKKATNLVTYLKHAEIENFIQSCMRRHFKLIDHKKVIEEAEENI
jgi:hypothetical protein